MNNRLPIWLDDETCSHVAAGAVRFDHAQGSPVLSVIVPTFNEADTITELLLRVQAVPIDKQVIVVNDGSTDDTGKRIRSWPGFDHVQVLDHPDNRGKAAAIRLGLGSAKGQFTVIQDGDLECDPSDYNDLLQPLLDGKADVVFGSRYLDPARIRSRPSRVSRAGVTLLNLMVQWIYGVRLTDEATCYKVFPTSLLRSLELECERFEFCPEVTAKICRLGLRIREVPISYHPRSKQEGKKIRLWDGVDAIRTLWRLRHWSPRKRIEI